MAYDDGFYDDGLYDGGDTSGIIVVESSRTLRWSVDPSPNRVEWALWGRFGPVVTEFGLERRSLAGVLLEDISDGLLAGRVSLNVNRDVKRKAQLTIDPDIVTVDPDTDYLMPYQRVLVDGEVWWRLPLGLYAVMNPAKTTAPEHHSWELQCEGVEWLLANDGPTSPYTVAAGTSYTTAALAVIAAANADLRAELPPTDKVLPVAMTWNPPLTWAQILTHDGLGLLDGIGYYQAWSDQYGVIRSREREDASSASADVTYTGHDIVLGEPISEDRPMVHFNRIVALLEDPQQETKVGVAVNADPSSPISTVSTGRTLTRYVQAPRAADQTTLDNIAATALRDEASDLVHLEFSTLPDGRRDAWEVFMFEVEGEYEAVTWQSQSWDLTMAPGASMQHRVRRTAAVAVT